MANPINPMGAPGYVPAGASPATPPPVSPLDYGMGTSLDAAGMWAYMNLTLGFTQALSSGALPSMQDFLLTFINPDTAAAMVANRNGSVLGPGRFLKPDQFPGLHQTFLQDKDHQPLLEGAPNFRRIGDEPIYGVAQPTVQGIRNVLNQVGAGPGGSGPAAVWTNMRQEPVVYINGKPFNPRDMKQPMENIDQPGKNGAEVEESDGRLKQDILEEARRNGGWILIHEEGPPPDHALVARKEYIDENSVQTPREVYQQLQKEGYRVDYARVPVADEQSPDPAAFDALVERLKNVDPNAPEIFNCHAGRGRTTTGDVVADMIRRAKQGKSGSITDSDAVHEDIREQGAGNKSDYRCILRLIEALQNGGAAKADADQSMDKAGVVQNLRNIIAKQKADADREPDGDKKAAMQKRAQDYLQRYFYLIAFDEYTKEQASSNFSKPFSQWAQENHVAENLGTLELAMGFGQPSGTAVA